MDQNSELIREKFGPQFGNANKKRVLNGWIKGAIADYERGQDDSLKNLELQSKLNDSNTHIDDSGQPLRFSQPVFS